MSNTTLHSDVDQVRDATDLVQLIGEHIALRAKGREHVGLCPFHDDHKPSFAVVTHKGNAFYKCHSCGAGGDAIEFVKNYHKMDFMDALRFLADRAGITLTPKKRTGDQPTTADGPSRSELRDANALAAEFFQHVLQTESAGKVGREILTQRDITPEMAEQFMIGLAPDQWDALLKVITRRNLSESHFLAAGLLKQRQTGGTYDAFRNRLIFPICSEVGQPVAFGARKIAPDDEPKYLNSSESAIFHKSRTLYGLHLAKRAIIESKFAVITEGYTDVIACHQRGICNVVGTLGTALTPEHASILSRLCHTVVLLFDGDEAGLRAADRGLEVFFSQPVDVRICALPGGADPDDLLRQEGGADQLRAFIADAQDALEFKVKRFRDVLQHAQGVSARQKQLEDFLQELAQLGFTAIPGVRKRLILTQLSDLLAIPVHEIEQAIPRVRKPVSHTPAQPLTSVTPEVDPAHAQQLHVTRARRCAEHELLALLLFDPELGGVSIALEAGESGRITEIFQPGNFLDDASRAIAERMFAWLEMGETFTMQRVLGELHSDDAKRLASSLYFDGERHCGQAPNPGEELRMAANALLNHMNRELYDQSVAGFRQTRSQTPDADRSAEVVRLLDQRKQQQTIAHAIATGVRS